MRSFEDLQNAIYEYGSKIGAPKSDLRIYPAPQPDGTPYVRIDEHHYYYILEERGYELARYSTTHFDVICYWLMDDIVSKMAGQYELANRIEGQDPRRIRFRKELDLMGALSQDWLKISEREIKEILERSPFTDRS